MLDCEVYNMKRQILGRKFSGFLALSFSLSNAEPLLVDNFSLKLPASQNNSNYLEWCLYMNDSMTVLTLNSVV